jgi:hypothetical protein
MTWVIESLLGSAILAVFGGVRGVVIAPPSRREHAGPSQGARSGYMANRAMGGAGRALGYEKKP